MCMINQRSRERVSPWAFLGQTAGGSFHEAELPEQINGYLKTSSQSLVLPGRFALDVGTCFN